MKMVTFIVLLLVAIHLTIWVSSFPMVNVINDLSSETQAEYDMQRAKMTVISGNRIIPITASVIALLLSTVSIITTVKVSKTFTKRRWAWSLLIIWEVYLLMIAVSFLIMTIVVFRIMGQ